MCSRWSYVCVLLVRVYLSRLVVSRLASGVRASLCQTVMFVSLPLYFLAFRLGFPVAYIPRCIRGFSSGLFSRSARLFVVSRSPLRAPSAAFLACALHEDICTAMPVSSFVFGSELIPPLSTRGLFALICFSGIVPSVCCPPRVSRCFGSESCPHVDNPGDFPSGTCPCLGPGCFSVMGIPSCVASWMYTFLAVAAFFTT